MTVKDLIKKSPAPRLWFYAASPFSRKILTDTTAHARQTLEAFYPSLPSTAHADNRIDSPAAFDVMICVGAYNIAEFLPECLDSILSQKTRYTYQIIVVDDGSSDDTPAIADRYGADKRVKVIHQKNGGCSAAGNAALARITGEYVMFVDGDDVLLPGAIDALMDTAKETGIPIVEGSSYYIDNGKRSDICTKYKKKEEVVPQGNLTGFPWGKVYRSELFRDLKYPEGYNHRDSIFSFLMFPTVERAVRLPDFVYGYRRNTGSITATSASKPKCLDTLRITELLMKEHRERHLPEDALYFEKCLRQFLLNNRRTKKMPKEIREAIFTVTCELTRTYIDDGFHSSVHEPFLRALRKEDFGTYVLYGKTH